MAEPGWYSSKAVPGFERYWDGTSWTEEYREASAILSENNDVPIPQSQFQRPEQEKDPLLAEGALKEPQPPAPKPHIYTPTDAYGRRIIAGQQNSDAVGIVAIIFAFILPLVGAILGHIAYAKVRPDGSRSGLGLAAIIIGWLFTLLSMVLFLFAFLGIYKDYNYFDSYEPYDYESSTTPIFIEFAAEEILEEQNFFENGSWIVYCDASGDDEFLPGSLYACDAEWFSYSGDGEYKTFAVEVEILGGDYYDPEVLVSYTDENGETRQLVKNDSLSSLPS